MEFSAIFHQSDSVYSFPVGGSRARIRLRTKRDDTIKNVKLIWNTSHKFYLDRVSEEMKVRYKDKFFDYYEIDIDNGEPGYSYVFSLEDADGRVYFYNESGFSEILYLNATFEDNFTVNYPNELDIIYPNKEFEGRVFYQIFPERFCRSSDKTNTEYIDMEWDTDEPTNEHFAGGDLNGIKEKLPYLSELGIGAIYLNPIHPSVSAHKYDVDDYFGIDPMFGTAEDFKALVKEAHKRDIKIVMDLVFNHSSYSNPMFQDVVKNGRSSKYYDWYFVDGDKPDWDKCNYKTFCGVRMMPKLNTNNPEVQEYLVSVGEYYIKECDVDGFRLDVAFDVSHEFWRYFKFRLKKLNPNIFIIGEDWLNSLSFLGNDQWDSVMNYQIMYGCDRYLHAGRYNAKDFADYMNSVLMRYTDGTNRNMMNLLDSHDTARFFTRGKEDLDLQLAALALLVFYIGSPTIYYGDEIFMTGEQDPYNRKPMKWNSKMFDSEEHKAVKKLLDYRREDILKYGDIEILEKDDVVFMKRSYKGQTLTLAVNNSGAEKRLSAKPEYDRNVNGNILEHKGFAIIRE